MRVTITDKEALRALSWQAVETYLDAAGWQQSEDIPGKSVAYQHTDKGGRLWEILVLLRDDLHVPSGRRRDVHGRERMPERLLRGRRLLQHRLRRHLSGLLSGQEGLRL